jgi:FMN phosphatase YigB (HAD superfamily)
MRKKAIVVDLDGTLFNIDHRLYHIQQDPKNWTAFAAGIPLDTINPWCEQLVWAMRLQNYEIIYLTGRKNDEERATRESLYRHLGSAGLKDPLFMRNPRHNKLDSIFKVEVLRQLIEPNYEVLFVIDDRPSVIRSIREAGFVVLAVNDKEF